MLFCYFCQSIFISQVTGKCGSVLVRLIPAPRGTSIVAAGVSKKLLQMAGVSDCYTSARGQTATLGNFGTKFVFLCVAKFLSFLIYMQSALLC